MKLHVIIASPNREFNEAAEWWFRDIETVEIFAGKFEAVTSFDCMVTAGNCFGLMDAGIDLAAVKYFGIGIQDKIQQTIREEFLGEQPVGTSFLVETEMAAHPFVAHTPTMRIPANISLTDHVYQATWATLLAIHRHNRAENQNRQIYTAVFPAFGAGTGGVPPMEAAYQMKLAYEHYLNPPEHLNGSVAQNRHEKIHYGSNWGFQHPRESYPEL